jgi:hypothetical protein
MVVVAEVEQAWVGAGAFLALADEDEHQHLTSVLDAATREGAIEDAPPDSEDTTRLEARPEPLPEVAPQKTRRPMRVVAPEVVRPTRMRPPRVVRPEAALEGASEDAPGVAAVKMARSPEDILEARKTVSEPLWDGIKGVTNTPNREKELGLGKWTAQGRTPEEIRRALPGSPPRELDLSVERPTWPLVAVTVLLLMAGMGWLWQVSFSQQGADVGVPGSGEERPAEDP